MQQCAQKGASSDHYGAGMKIDAQIGVNADYTT